ncbi:MFS transporter [Streptomyces sp. NPDC056296]|uniref:MFS transporter n=1 Tax=Streptomyces sp. NPDC056296 TaxID=3345775 RepID=UPI0035D5B68B
MSNGEQSVTSGSTQIKWGILAVAFLAVLSDGFDTAALAASVPAMADDWGVPVGDFTLPLALTNLGVVVGYMTAGWLGAALGRKQLLIGSVAACSILTILSAVVLPLESMALFSGVRLATGAAIGILLPVAVSVTTDMVPERYRQRVSVGVTLGLPVGLIVGGLVGSPLLDLFGSGGIFWAGGIAGIILLVAMAAVLEEPPAVGTKTEAKKAAGVARLFDPAFRANTGLLWAFAFLLFIGAYTLSSWVPVLLLDYGFSANDAPIGLAVVSFGGVLGCLLVIPLTARIGISAVMAVMTALGIGCMGLFGLTSFGSWGVLLLLAGAGAGTMAGQMGVLTMAVAVYPAGARTTGVGMATALGRIGTIVGPAVAGALIAQGMGASNVIVLAAVPVALACAAAIALALRDRSKADDDRTQPALGPDDRSRVL